MTPPSYRFDLQIEEDLIEEVARVYGFENIPVRPPLAPAVMRSQPEDCRSQHALRARLAAAGYQEVINFGFVEADWERDFAGDADPIRLLNPIASQLAVMRTSLIGGLVDKVRYNLNRRQPRVRLFELGRVFLRQPGAPEGALEVAGIRQPTRVAAIAFGPADEEQWGTRPRSVEFFDVKGDLEALAAPLQLTFEPARHPALHPGRSARIALHDAAIGWIGELHPQWQQKYELSAPAVLFEVDAAPLLSIPVPAYAPVSRFPTVTRDLSFLVDEAMPVQPLLDDLTALRAPGVQRVSIFDLYQGEGVQKGKKSLAFRVLLQDTEKTLTDADVDFATQQLRDRLERNWGAQLRGNEG